MSNSSGNIANIQHPGLDYSGTGGMGDFGLEIPATLDTPAEKLSFWYIYQSMAFLPDSSGNRDTSGMSQEPGRFNGHVNGYLATLPSSERPNDSDSTSTKAAFYNNSKYRKGFSQYVYTQLGIESKVNAIMNPVLTRANQLDYQNLQDYLRIRYLGRSSENLVKQMTWQQNAIDRITGAAQHVNTILEYFNNGKPNGSSSEPIKDIADDNTVTYTKRIDKQTVDTGATLTEPKFHYVFNDLDYSTAKTQFKTAREELKKIVDRGNSEPGSTDTSYKAMNDTLKEVISSLNNVENYSNDDMRKLLSSTKGSNSDPQYFKFESTLMSASIMLQTMGDESRSDLQKSFFTFEQFYKSAGNILSQLNTIFDKIGRGISQ